jgi:hypothetical protein
MWAFLFLLAAALIGIAAMRIFASAILNIAEQMVSGIIVGWMMATTATYAVAAMRRALSRELVVVVTITALAVAMAACLFAIKRDRRAASGGPSMHRAECVSLVLLLAAFLPIYCALFRTRMALVKPDGIYSGGTSVYDMAFHLAISTSFLYGQNFPPIYPLLPPEPLLYPPLPDFLTAVLVAGGMSFHTALCLTGVTLATAITALLYLFASRMLAAGAAPSWHAAGAAVLAAVLFLLNGGLQFAYSVWNAFGHAAESHIEWTNIIADGLLPQRASLFGLPATLLVFGVFAGVWWRWTNESQHSRWSGWQMLAAAGVLTAALPLFHTHSYLAIVIVSGALFVLRPRTAWVAFWAPAILLALPRVLQLAQHASGGGNLRWQPGWLGHSDLSWPLVWLNNAGLPTLLIIPAWLNARREWRRFYLAFVALLVVALLVVVSARDTDNLKLMMYWHVITCVLVAEWLVRLAFAQRQRVLASALVLGCIASGLLALRDETASRTLMSSRAQMDAADFIREHTAPDALFLAAPTLHDPVVGLAGRAVVRGDTAWLWSHGYDFRAREADVKRIYAGAPDAAALLNYYRVDYIYVGDDERRELRADDTAFDVRFPAIYDGAGIKIYDTRAGGGARDGRAHEPQPREFAARLATDPGQPLVAFPQIGYFVYRFYVVSLGRQPRFEEFMRDLSAVGRGVYIGASGWEQQLEQNRRAFLQESSGRLSAQTSAEQLTRAIENPQLYRREYAAAYLLMHYFGYLRRNPEDPPEGSHAGYDFWLAELKRTHDYNAVTRAFLESSEYRSRPIAAELQH